MKNSVLLKLFLILIAVLLIVPINVFASDENTDTVLDEDGIFKVLFIGNSFSADATDADYSDDSILYEIMKSMVGDSLQINVGVAMSGAKPFAWHATVAESNSPVYTFIYFEGENQRQILGSSERTSQEVLTYTDWDAIVLQPYARELETGVSMREHQEVVKLCPLKASTPYLLDHVKTFAEQADIYLYLIWADASDTTVFDAAREDYNKICNYTRLAETYTGTTTGAGFKDTIPVGAAVQAIRGTYIAKFNVNTEAEEVELSTDPQIGIQRDGVHLSFSIGRYLAGLTCAEVLIPEEWRVKDYTLPPLRTSAIAGELPEEYLELIRHAVDAALSSAELEGNEKYNVDCLAGYEEDPIELIKSELEAYTYTFSNIQNAEELEQAWESKLTEGTSYDITGDISVEGNVTSGEQITANLNFRHGYLTGTATVTANITIDPPDTQDTTSDTGTDVTPPQDDADKLQPALLISIIVIVAAVLLTVIAICIKKVKK